MSRDGTLGSSWSTSDLWSQPSDYQSFKKKKSKREKNINTFIWVILLIPIWQDFIWNGTLSVSAWSRCYCKLASAQIKTLLMIILSGCQREKKQKNKTPSTVKQAAAASFPWLGHTDPSEVTAESNTSRVEGEPYKYTLCVLGYYFSWITKMLKKVQKAGNSCHRCAVPRECVCAHNSLWQPHQNCQNVDWYWFGQLVLIFDWFITAYAHNDYVRSHCHTVSALAPSAMLLTAHYLHTLQNIWEGPAGFY